MNAGCCETFGKRKKSRAAGECFLRFPKVEQHAAQVHGWRYPARKTIWYSFIPKFANYGCYMVSTLKTFFDIELFEILTEITTVKQRKTFLNLMMKWEAQFAFTPHDLKIQKQQQKFDYKIKIIQQYSPLPFFHVKYCHIVLFVV